MRPISPQSWAEDLSGPPILASDRLGWRTGLLRRWRGTEALMSQPPLDHHYVVLHLGGAKRVARTGAGRTVTAEVEEGALTLVPAGTRYEWDTRGPIDFAHLYIHPARLSRAVAALSSHDASQVTLVDGVGLLNPLLSRVMMEMLTELERSGGAGGPYLDTLFDLALANIARNHVATGPGAALTPHALAPVRLRRVLDHVEQALAGAVDLTQLARVAGLSRFHFSRAFHNAMGEPPLAYVARRRLEIAKRLLRDSELPLAEIARRTGHGSPSHFSQAFRRRTGVAPSQFRRQL